MHVSTFIIKALKHQNLRKYAKRRCCWVSQTNDVRSSQALYAEALLDKPYNAKFHDYS